VIFTTVPYFLFLIPTAVLFRIAGPRVRPWICVASGVIFFVYFSVTELAGWVGAACVLIFVWESLISRLYRPSSRWCLVGVAASLGVLAAFKYWNFFTGLATASLDANPFYWPGAFLPLGVSFFTFEFIHYAVDRYKNRVERGTLGEYLAFIFFFPTLVAGPIKRFQYFAPNLRQPGADWVTDWHRGGTRILVGLHREGDEAVLTVHDDGPGIDPAIADELFERFSRADRSRARKTGGTGLGLSIARAIVEAHHGSIAAESVPGDTTFTVRLPVSQP